MKQKLLIGLLFFASWQTFAKDNSFPYRIKTKDLRDISLTKGKNSEVLYWIEGPEETLIRARQPLALKGAQLLESKGEWLLAYGYTKKDLRDAGLKILLYAARGAVIEAPPKKSLLKLHSHGFVTPIKKPVILAQKPIRSAEKWGLTPLFPKLREKLSAKRWLHTIQKLETFPRYSKSEAGTSQTLTFLQEEIRSLSDWETTLEDFAFGSRGGKNLVLTKKGRPATILIGAHYDSISESPYESAPGAEDNASGVAVLLEIARALQGESLIPTIQLVFFGAEEQGLIGSRAFVEKIEDQKDDYHAVLVLDMVGFNHKDPIDFLIESSADLKPFVEDMVAIGQSLEGFDLVTTTHYWGSDHVPFIDSGFKAALLIENDYGDYDHYHRTSDQARWLSQDQGQMALDYTLALVLHWASELTPSPQL